MARVEAVGLTSDVLATGGMRLWEEMPSSDYVSVLCTDPSTTGLLWREIKRMMRWASSAARGPLQLTEWQTTVLECYFLGNLDTETAERFCCSRPNVTRARLIGLAKLDRYPRKPRGLLTVMCETFPWSVIRDHLADLAEEWADRQTGRRRRKRR